MAFIISAPQQAPKFRQIRWGYTKNDAADRTRQKAGPAARPRVFSRPRLRGSLQARRTNDPWRHPDFPAGRARRSDALPGRASLVLGLCRRPPRHGGVVTRYRPIKGGALLPALLGGAYSSTATTVVLAKRQREARTRRPELSAGIIAATAIMYPRLTVLVALFNLPLAARLLPTLSFLFIAGAVWAWWEWRKIEPESAEDLAIPAANPLQLTTALIFAGLFLAISLVTAWVESIFGQAGILTLAALVGAGDIDPFVLNLAQGGAPDMGITALAAAVLIAASANNLAKAVYAIGFGGLAAGGRPAIALTVLALLGFAAAVAYLA